MKMTKGVTVVEHLNEFNIVTSQLTLIDINFGNEIRVLLILSSFSKSWDGLVMELRNSLGLGTLKFNDVVSILISGEVRKNSTNEMSKSREKSKSAKPCVEC